MKHISIITNYMYWLENSIRNAYLDYIYINHLNEAYKPLGIDPNKIKSSLLSLLYSNRERIDNLSDNELLDILNDEFIKARIIFVPILESDKRIELKPKYKESGLIYAETDYLVEIYVSDRFFEILRKADIDNNDSSIIKLANDIYSLYSHEATHINQTDLEKVPQRGIDPNTIDTPAKEHLYLGQIREIAAHAREVANQLLLTNKTPKEIEILLTTTAGNNYLKDNYPIYKRYWDAFGIAKNIAKASRDKDAKNRIYIFNRFKKYLVYFLKTDLRFFYHDDLKYTFGGE